MKNKEERKKINRTIFSKYETIVTDDNIDMFCLFPKFKGMIELHYGNGVDIRVYDGGRHISVEWRLVLNEKSSSTRLATYESFEINNILLELYPKCEDELREEADKKALTVKQRFNVTAKTNDKFRFGKYKNKKVLDIKESDPKYFTWCMDNINEFPEYVLNIENKQ